MRSGPDIVCVCVCLCACVCVCVCTSMNVQCYLIVRLADGVRPSRLVC